MPLILVRDGKVFSTAGTPPAKHNSGDNNVPYTPGVIVTDSTSVMALRTDTGISRIVGPGTASGQSPSGVIFTDWYNL